MVLTSPIILSIRFSMCNIIPLYTRQKYPYFTFSSPFCVEFFLLLFFHVPRGNKTESYCPISHFFILLKEQDHQDVIFFHKITV